MVEIIRVAVSMKLQQLGKALIMAGFLSFFASIVWWYMFFEQLLAEDVKRASKCFYQTTTDCAISNAVISTLGDIPVYSPDLLWLATGLAGLGIILLGMKSGDNRENKK